MSKRTMETLKANLCKELDGFVKGGEISRSDLEDIHILTDTIKNLEKILLMDEQDYSYDGEWTAMGSYANDSYGNGSYANDGYNSRRSGRNRHYVRGHYSYGEDTDMLMDKMERLMQDGRMTNEEKGIMRKAMDLLGK